MQPLSRRDSRYLEPILHTDSAIVGRDRVMDHGPEMIPLLIIVLSIVRSWQREHGSSTRGA